jgi:hypothetical protein
MDHLSQRRAAIWYCDTWPDINLERDHHASVRWPGRLGAEHAHVFHTITNNRNQEIMEYNSEWPVSVRFPLCSPETMVAYVMPCVICRLTLDSCYPLLLISSGFQIGFLIV